MSLLFTPATLGPLSLPNRIVIAPMCQYSAEEGCASDWHMMHLGNLAQSGAGLLILEATAVEAIGRISPRDLGLWNDANEAALRRVIQAIRRYAPASLKLAIQLGHAGRKASSQVPWEGGRQISPADGGWRTHAPSAVPHSDEEESPHAMNADDLGRVRQAFVDSAVRAKRLGFEAIELHGAHGYLLHQFLSPLSNRRNDAYGGSLENRMRFPLEVFQAMREAVPDLCVGVRVSATDWVNGGWDEVQTIEFAQRLEAMGCDFIHVSSGGLSPLQQIPVAPGYQVPQAVAVKRAVSMPVISVGLITEAEQAEAILQEGQADLIALARGVLYDPRWPWHAAAKLNAQVDAPPQYWRCQPHGLKALFNDSRFGQR